MYVIAGEDLIGLVGTRLLCEPTLEILLNLLLRDGVPLPHILSAFFYQLAHAESVLDLFQRAVLRELIENLLGNLLGACHGTIVRLLVYLVGVEHRSSAGARKLSGAEGNAPWGLPRGSERKPVEHLGPHGEKARQLGPVSEPLGVVDPHGMMPAAEVDFYRHAGPVKVGLLRCGLGR